MSAHFSVMKTVIPVILVSLVGCNGGDDSGSENTDTTGIDITNQMFTNRSGDCAEYLGNFFSNVNDLQRTLAFNGQIQITAAGSKCVVQSNAIPNHDFNDASASFATNVTEQSSYYEFTASPVIAGSTTDLSLGTTEAVFLNGVKVDLLAAACYGVGDERTGCGQSEISNPWRYDPMSSLNGFGN